ncbi:MAG: archaetidylserine decarboxylase, partial [Opitutales bacterium]|nr:archaetidylserine decarboxylase [Opitutales bacterium]
FIKKYGIKEESLEKKIDDFSSFNDFFTRKLKPSARPISPRSNSIIAPSDGRVLVYNSISDTTPFFVKGEKLSISKLTRNPKFVKIFKNAGLAIIRLAPIDCHRFCFPIDCEPQMTYLINGSYLSVNPIAMKGSLKTFLENKRMSTLLCTKTCGNILMVEIGGTCVGSIKQTFSPFKKALKGQEKGYFEFGGSTVLLLFEHEKVKFADDILENTMNGIETYVLMGDSIATVAQNE